MIFLKDPVTILFLRHHCVPGYLKLVFQLINRAACQSELMFGGNSVNHSFSFAADLSNGAVKKEASTKEVARIWINDIKMRSFSPTVVSGTNDSFAKPVCCCWPQTVVASSRSCSYLSCVWWSCQVHLFVQKVSCSTR